MTNWTRRGFVIAGSASLAGCTTSGLSKSRNQLDQEADIARAELFRTVPGAQQLAAQAAGILIVPDIKQAGLIVGGAYGEGVLMIGEAKVDYFSYAAGSFGLQFGVQRYAHALFFMTQEVLAGFRFSDGWQLGVDAEFTTPQDALSVGVTTNTINRPVHAVVFGNRGLLVGATLEGAKYSRVIR